MNLITMRESDNPPSQCEARRCAGQRWRRPRWQSQVSFPPPYLLELVKVSKVKDKVRSISVRYPPLLHTFMCESCESGEKVNDKVRSILVWYPPLLHTCYHL